MGFFGSLAKIGAAAAGFAVGGPAGAVAGFKAASVLVNKPAVAATWIAPPPPPPEPAAPYTLPNWSYQGGGAGGGPVTAFTDVTPLAKPAANGQPATFATATLQPVKSKHANLKRAKPKKSKPAKRTKAKKAKKAKGPKFGSPAWRKKYM